MTQSNRKIQPKVTLNALEQIHPHAAGIDIVLLRIGPQKPHSAFHILHLCGEDELRAEAVAEGGADIPALREFPEDEQLVIEG